MKSKERVLTTFANQEPDCVPVGFAGINGAIFKRLIDYFGLHPDDDEGFYRSLGVDYRTFNSPYRGPRLHPEIPDRIINSEWGYHARWIENPSGGYWDYCDFPLKDADEEQVSAWPMPSPDDYDYSKIVEFCNCWKDYAVFTGHPGIGDIINSNGFLRGTEQALVDLITENPAGLLLAKRRTDIQLEVLRRTLETAKGKIDLLWMGEDLGGQSSPLISLKLYRKVIRPLHQKFIDLARSFNIPVMVHTCGSSSWVYEDFIEMGVTVVDTLQPEAKDMSPSYLKEHFGGRLAFHGCISTAGPLAYGSVDDVIDNVKKTFGIMMPGGGYCMAPTHSIQDNTPVENVVALYQATRKYGIYR
jgi:uroporphyrinogen decarboxylase